MKLTFQKKTFVDNLLGPVSKLSDNLLLEFKEKDKGYIAKTLVTSADNSVILLSNIDCKVDNPFRCVIPDCKTFLRLFSGIEQDNITLDVDSNVIKYKDKSFSFKYHLLDESYIVNKKSINEDRLANLSFDTTFSVTKSVLSDIVKYNSIVPDAEKLYFFTDSSSVSAKLGDEQKTNTNEIVTEISEAFEGTPLSGTFPINIQNLLLFSFAGDNANQINVSINHQLKVFKFTNANLTYIVSGLVR